MYYRNCMLERNHQHCRSLPNKHTSTRRQNSFFLHSLAPGLFNVVPANKAKIVKGPRCMLKEKGKRLNLKMRGNKLINGTVIF